MDLSGRASNDCSLVPLPSLLTPSPSTPSTYTQLEGDDMEFAGTGVPEAIPRVQTTHGGVQQEPPASTYYEKCIILFQQEGQVSTREGTICFRK